MKTAAFTPRPLGKELEYPTYEGNWLWIRQYWTPEGEARLACIAQVKSIDGKLWVNLGDCRSEGALFEPASLHRWGWYSISQHDELNEYIKSNALWQKQCENLTSQNRDLSESTTALLEALEAISALRPPLMTKEQEKAFEHYPSTCDAYRVDLSKVLLQALTQARQAIAMVKGGK